MSTWKVSIFRAAGIAAIAVFGVGLGCDGDNGANPTDSYTLNIEVNPLGSGTVSRDPNNTVYRAGTVVTVKATAKSDYEFVSWSGALNDAASSVTVTMNGNVALTANFRSRTVTPPVSNTFTDSRDGKTYRKITIGYQTWMAENLNYNASGSLCYDNITSNCTKYGRLYNWATAMNGFSSSSSNPSGVRGVCPVGWHLPSDAEWSTLVNYVGGPSGTKLKATSGWYNAYNGTDDYGFLALPGGAGRSDNSFIRAGYYGYWWSATENVAVDAWNRDMNYYNEYVDRFFSIKSILFSVRCVQD
jgi:uncharacterized protein (TIGR02145 family)